MHIIVVSVILIYSGNLMLFHHENFQLNIFYFLKSNYSLFQRDSHQKHMIVLKSLFTLTNYNWIQFCFRKI